jgi:uncharacterized membrane protein
MKLLLYVFGVCLTIYALQLAIFGVAVVLAIVLVIGFLTRPREMLQGILVAAIWGLLERYPAQFLGLGITLICLTRI